MKLYSKIYGNEGPSLVIIHGLFGMSDNWNSLAKEFAKDFKVYIIDLRNHGKSPHSDEFNYDVMCEDLVEYMEDYNIAYPILLGHSLGGKVAMKFAFKYPEKIAKLIVADIAPRSYDTDFAQTLLQTLYKLPLEEFEKRDDVDHFLSSMYTDRGMRLFLMKNLCRNENKEFAWRFNIDVLLEKVSNIQEADFISGICDVPTCFIRGGDSNYITTDDERIINKHFSEFNIVTVSGAGHWLHAEKPKEFYNKAIEFCLI